MFLWLMVVRWMEYQRNKNFLLSLSCLIMSVCLNGRKKKGFFLKKFSFEFCLNFVLCLFMIFFFPFFLHRYTSVNVLISPREGRVPSKCNPSLILPDHAFKVLFCFFYVVFSELVFGAFFLHFFFLNQQNFRGFLPGRIDCMRSFLKSQLFFILK